MISLIIKFCSLRYNIIKHPHTQLIELICASAEL
jgi:hypothetical protein